MDKNEEERKFSSSQNEDSDDNQDCQDEDDEQLFDEDEDEDDIEVNSNLDQNDTLDKTEITGEPDDEVDDDFDDVADEPLDEDMDDIDDAANEMLEEKNVEDVDDAANEPLEEDGDDINEEMNEPEEEKEGDNNESEKSVGEKSNEVPEENAQVKRTVKEKAETNQGGKNKQLENQDFDSAEEEVNADDIKEAVDYFKSDEKDEGSTKDNKRKVKIQLLPKSGKRKRGRPPKIKAKATESEKVPAQGLLVSSGSAFNESKMRTALSYPSRQKKTYKKKKAKYHCLVYYCDHNTENYDDFYLLPMKTNYELAYEWYKICTKSYPTGETRPEFPGREEITRTTEKHRYFRVCKEHFKQEDFDSWIHGELVGMKKKPNLKDDAVPSLYLTKADFKKKNPDGTPVLSKREERQAAKERKELVEKLIEEFDQQNEAAVAEAKKISPMTSKGAMANQMPQVVSSTSLQSIIMEKLTGLQPDSDNRSAKPSIVREGTSILLPSFPAGPGAKKRKRDVAIQFPSYVSLKEDLRSEEILLSNMKKVQYRITELEGLIPLTENSVFNLKEKLIELRKEHSDIVDPETGLPKEGKITLTERVKSFIQDYNSKCEELQTLESRLTALNYERSTLMSNPYSRPIEADSLINYLRQRVVGLMIELTKSRERVHSLTNETNKNNRMINQLKNSCNKLKQKMTDKKASRREVVSYLRNITSNSMINFIFGISSNQGKTHDFFVKNWTRKEIVNAILLRSISSKAFNFLRAKRMMPLPSLKTLKRWFPALEMENIFDTKKLRDAESKEIRYWIPDPERVEYMKLKKVERIETLKFQRRELLEEQKKSRKRQKAATANNTSSTETPKAKRQKTAVSSPTLQERSKKKKTKKVVQEHQYIHQDHYETIDGSMQNAFVTAMNEDQTGAAVSSIIYEEDGTTFIPPTSNEVTVQPSSSGSYFTTTPYLTNQTQEIKFIKLSGEEPVFTQTISKPAQIPASNILTQASGDAILSTSMNEIYGGNRQTGFQTMSHRVEIEKDPVYQEQLQQQKQLMETQKQLTDQLKKQQMEIAKLQKLQKEEIKKKSDPKLKGGGGKKTTSKQQAQKDKKSVTAEIKTIKDESVDDVSNVSPIPKKIFVPVKDDLSETTEDSLPYENSATAASGSEKQTSFDQVLVENASSVPESSTVIEMETQTTVKADPQPETATPPPSGVQQYVIQNFNDESLPPLDEETLATLEKQISQLSNLNMNPNAPILIPTMVNGALKHILLKPVQNQE